MLTPYPQFLTPKARVNISWAPYLLEMIIIATGYLQGAAIEGCNALHPSYSIA